MVKLLASHISSNGRSQFGAIKIGASVKENQENDKIGSKPDKNGKGVEAEKSLKQLQWVEEEKLNKTQKEWPKIKTQSKAIQNWYGTPCESLRESGEAMSARRSERPQKGRRWSCRLLKGMGLLLVKVFKPSMNSNWWGIPTSIRWSRTGTELLANLYANLGKQCLQGVLNGRRKVDVGKMSILRGQKSVPGMNSRKRGKRKEKTTRNILDICPRVKGELFTEEYGLPIPDMMLNDEIKRSESYQMFIKYSTGLIPPKKSRGVLDESTAIFHSSNEGTGDKPGVPDEVKDISSAKADITFDWWSEYKSDMLEDSQLNLDEQDKKNEDNDGDNKGEDDDHISDIQEYNKTESDEEDIYKMEINLEDDDERKIAKEDKGDKEPAINVAVTLKEILGFRPPPLIFTHVTVEQTTTPIPTPPITIEASIITTVVPIFDALIVIHLRSIELEKDVYEMKKIDHSAKALASLKSQVPTVINNYLGFKLSDALQKIMSEIHKIKKEQAEKQKLSKNTANHALYHALMEALIVDEEAMDKGVAASVKHHKRQHDDEDDDEDPSAGPNQGKMIKRRRTKESNSSKNPSTTKETSKGKALTKSSKTSKSVTEKEPVEEPIAEVVMDDLESTANEDVVNVVDQSQDDVAPKTMRPSKDIWFKQPPRPPTPEPEWNTVEVVDNAPEEQWFNDLLSAEKETLTFHTLMATPVYFSKFAMHRLKIDKLTRAHLIGHVYKLLKCTCEGSVELEYNMEECLNASTDKLEWNNSEGGQYPFDLTKPLPLKGYPGRVTVVTDYFFNNDLEF
nr:hypothetical protein [Tanacetum cinerariifolium]